MRSFLGCARGIGEASIRQSLQIAAATLLDFRVEDRYVRSFPLNASLAVTHFSFHWHSSPVYTTCIEMYNPEVILNTWQFVFSGIVLWHDSAGNSKKE